MNAGTTIDPFNGSVVTGHISTVIGIVTITEGNTTLNKVVRADSTGSFSLALSLADLSMFTSGQLTLTAKSIHTSYSYASTSQFVNNPSHYQVVSSASETATFLRGATVLDANPAQDLGSITPTQQNPFLINHFNSNDGIHMPANIVTQNWSDSRIAVNVGAATTIDLYQNGPGTEVDIYIGGLSAHGRTGPSVVVKGDMTDLDGDNITIVGTHGSSSVNWGGSGVHAGVNFNYHAGL